MSPQYISDDQWMAIVSEIPRGLEARLLNAEAEYRSFISAVLWVARHRQRWSRLASQGWSGTHAIYVRYHRWRQAGTWQYVIAALGPNTEEGAALARLVAEGRWIKPGAV
ncbi:transposase [Lysobacter antibioticus]|uniref:transposase n=1 Tax=Lysobacter antibioticus TaxID=84531 RepID=UPI00094EFF35